LIGRKPFHPTIHLFFHTNTHFAVHPFQSYFLRAMYPVNSTSNSLAKTASTSMVDEDPSVVEISHDRHPSAPSLERTLSKQRKIPAPIKIYSNYSDSNEPRTAIYTPAMPFSSTPNSGNARNQSTTPQRPAPTPPMNRLHSILVLSAPKSGRRLPTPTEGGSGPPSNDVCSHTTINKGPKNVRFAAVQSPAFSNLKSPAYFDNFRSSLSPMPYSPKTPDTMSFQDPDIVPESPIEDAPMISVTPIEDTFREVEKQEQSILPRSGRGRQFDPETFLRLTGRDPSPEISEQDSTCSVPDLGREIVLISSNEDNDSAESPCLEPVYQTHTGEEKSALKVRLSAPASQSKRYLPKSLQTDREWILSSYFSPGFRPVSF
jgi:hypothetical protein